MGAWLKIENPGVPPAEALENKVAAITLAKALKLKNRLVGRMAKVQRDISSYNSVLIEHKDEVNVSELYELRKEIQDHIVNLKTSIILANVEVQSRIIELGELKAQMSWLQGIPTRDGIDRHDYQNTETTYFATIKKKDVDSETKKLESEIDNIQDALDEFNNIKKIEISQRTLDLAS